MYNRNTPVNILWNEFKILCRSCVDMIHIDCLMLMISHLGLLIASKDCQEKNNCDEPAWTTDVILNSVIIRGQKKATNNGKMSIYTKSTLASRAF